MNTSSSYNINNDVQLEFRTIFACAGGTFSFSRLGVHKTFHLHELTQVG